MVQLYEVQYTVIIYSVRKKKNNLYTGNKLNMITLPLCLSLSFNLFARCGRQALQRTKFQFDWSTSTFKLTHTPHRRLLITLLVIYTI